MDLEKEAEVFTEDWCDQAWSTAEEALIKLLKEAKKEGYIEGLKKACEIIKCEFESEDAH